MNQRRVTIVDIAGELIAEKGFAHTSVDDVIERAGLSGKSHFYHYFKSKEELGHEVLARQFDLLGERGLAILRDERLDPVDRLYEFIDAVVAMQADRGIRAGSPLGAMLTEIAEKDEAFRIRIARVFRNWTDQIVELLDAVQDRFEEQADHRRLARFIVATLEGATTMARMKRDTAVLQGVADDLKRYVAGHLRRRDGHEPRGLTR